MDNTTNDTDTTTQAAAGGRDDRGDGGLAAETPDGSVENEGRSDESADDAELKALRDEAARRRVEARQAQAELEDLRARVRAEQEREIVEAVQFEHSELTAEEIRYFCPADSVVDAQKWADEFWPTIEERLQWLRDAFIDRTVDVAADAWRLHSERSSAAFHERTQRAYQKREAEKRRREEERDREYRRAAEERYRQRTQGIDPLGVPDPDLQKYVDGSYQHGR